MMGIICNSLATGKVDIKLVIVTLGSKKSKMFLLQGNKFRANVKVRPDEQFSEGWVQCWVLFVDVSVS